MRCDSRVGDGGYVIGGSTIGCGSSTICPDLSGIQCGLIEKLDATGKLVWAQDYSTGTTATAVNQIRQTSDGGFLAVGSVHDTSLWRSASPRTRPISRESSSPSRQGGGLVGPCSQVDPATPLNAIDPGLATIAPALPVQTTIAASSNSPSRTQPTSISSTPGQC